VVFMLVVVAVVSTGGIAVASRGDISVVRAVARAL
jgi:hypothetical protein